VLNTEKILFWETNFYWEITFGYNSGWFRFPIPQGCTNRIGMFLRMLSRLPALPQ